MAKEKSQKSRSVTRRTIYYYLQELKQHKLLAVISTVALPLEIFLVSFAVPYVIAQIVDKLTVQTFTADELWPTFWSYILAVAVCAVLGRIFRMAEIYALWKLELDAIFNLARKVFSALSKHSMSFHNNRFGGSLVSQVGKFVHGFERLYDEIFFSFLPIIFSLVFVIVILMPIAPFFVIGLLIFVAFYTLIAWRSFKKIAPLNTALAKSENTQSGQLADSITNIMTVKSYAKEDFEKRRFKKVSYSVFIDSLKLMIACMKRDIAFSVVTSGITILLVAVMVGGQVWFGVSIGALIMIISYTQQITNQLWNINNIFRQVNRSFGDAYEMTMILDEPIEVFDVQDAKPLKVGLGNVKFDNISFTHTDGKDAVFSNFTLDIKPGQRIGLVGRSGSGKTTLTKLLLRFADVQRGTITIDGQNISEIMQESLRNNIAYVPQETTLFHRTIAENIAYGRPDASRQEIIKAAKLANAWEFIKDLPKGLDTLTGERGVKLSGGQRQRIAIARAILKDAPILVLDEATASLDTESEKLIQEALSRLMKGRTSIVVAHRLSTVAELDRIIVLDNGRIVEDGTHGKLVKSDGVYSRLWNRQAGVLE